jgi:hypothetical protein
MEMLYVFSNGYGFCISCIAGYGYGYGYGVFEDYCGILVNKTWFEKWKKQNEV